VAEKKPPEKAAEKELVHMPVSDVAVWDDDERMKAYPPVPWPRSGRSEEEVLAAAKKLTPPKGE
jgi:hypothetical protein